MKATYLASIFSQRKVVNATYPSAVEWWMQLEEVAHIYKREMETRECEDFLKSEI